MTYYYVLFFHRFVLVKSRTHCLKKLFFLTELFKKVIKQCVKELQLFTLCLFSSYLFKLLLSKPLKWNLKENNLMNKEKTINMYKKKKKKPQT